jgi:lysophospholipid acyltransferase (LPLAT)-like uncharacterized protein
VLISQSKDGDFGARAAERLGYRAVRGSSSRGGATALKSLARDLREAKDKTGGWIAIVADGPRGPRRAAKPGATWLAEHTGLPLWCVSAAAPGLSLQSWDRCRLPWPGARVMLRCAEAPISADDKTLGATMQENERRLREFLSLTA